MKILILGGTVFVGRHLVDSALQRGHEVTLFNRGQHNPELYPEVEKLRGDRDGDLSALEGRRWDAVIDTCGYVPRIVRASVDRLAGAVDQYAFISTISVFADTRRPGMDEDAPLGTLSDESVEEVTGETYGPLKALCERAVREGMPDRALIVRPGLIVGPNDPTDRFTYWPHRIARGGEVLAPGVPELPVQFIDVRDLAEWTIRLVEKRQNGTYNATAPDYRLEMGRVLEVCRQVSGSDARFTWIPDDWLLEHEVQPWMELPLWVTGDEEHRGFHAIDVSRAIAAGLTFRPLEQTVRDTLDWDATRPAKYTWRAGMAPEREQELLAAWHTEKAEAGAVRH